MSLIAGEELNHSEFFSKGKPEPRASSFDLTIGTIFDHDGRKICDPFKLKPGHMVQIVSAEVFDLPADVTGHVTYKTDLTKKGIWALTVGIVDPGWTGPVTTTLLNFGRVDHVMAPGAPFLRVSLFRHKKVTEASLMPKVSIDRYMGEAQEAAMTRFAPTFLNKDEIQKKAGNYVLKKIRTEALAWIAAIAILFTVIDWVNGAIRTSVFESGDEFASLRARVEQLQSQVHDLQTSKRVAEMRRARPPASPPAH